MAQAMWTQAQALAEKDGPRTQEADGSEGRVGDGVLSLSLVPSHPYRPHRKESEGLETPSIRIELPLVPPKQMSHNSRTSRWSNSRVSQRVRRQAKEGAEAALGGKPFPIPAPIRYDIEVYWGAGRLRCDEDGLLSMSKPAIDGVVDALGLTSDRQMHLGNIIQGRDADKKGWMAFVLSHDTRNHENIVRRMGE